MTDQLSLLFMVFVFGFCVGVIATSVTRYRRWDPIIRLSSARAGNQHVQLSWKDSWSLGNGSEEYTILRKDGVLSSWKVIGTTRKSSMIDTTVVPGKRYRYKVCGNQLALEGKSLQVSDCLTVKA